MIALHKPERATYSQAVEAQKNEYFFVHCDPVNGVIATAKRILTFYRSQKLRICFAVAIAARSWGGPLPAVGKKAIPQQPRLTPI